MSVTADTPARWCRQAVWLFLITAASAAVSSAEAAQEEISFRDNIERILDRYCFDCHGYGEKKGGVVLDAFPTDAEARQKTDLWLRVLKNTRAGIMPPADESRPEPGERARLEAWIKYTAFGIDPENPDPGRVTVRRLNRTEYANTIRDLMGIEFNAPEAFPPDDTAHGFDTIAEVLTVSPLLMEKYIEAAAQIVDEAVPKAPTALGTQQIAGKDFTSDDGAQVGNRLSFYAPATVGRAFTAPLAGTYRVTVTAEVRCSMNYDPGRCDVSFNIDGASVQRETYLWDEFKRYTTSLEQHWQPGEHTLQFALTPLRGKEEQLEDVQYRVQNVSIEGPLEPALWREPAAYRRFFLRDPAGLALENREAHARDVLRNFATRAFRRPVDETVLDRLGTIARATYQKPDHTFEQGIAQAMIAVLASPRFLFRVEQPLAADRAEAFARIDDYALASRLSYFLWATMPDDRLFELARTGRLRDELAPEVARMLQDPRARAFSDNFVGQWLQARDVLYVQIDANAVLGIAARRIGDERVEFSGALRRAMLDETQMTFSHLMQEDRSVLELLDSDYVFANEVLARHYGIPGVTGEDMRKVMLPPDSPRGGILTQGTVLAVTSNPTRTSPVKRGLFILDNLLATPPPQPPADIPALEDAKKAFTDHVPSVRELMALHREKPLCASCHERMDPLGLALENFNAMGGWRDFEVLPPKPRDRTIGNFSRKPTPEELTPVYGARIDASAELITGRKFDGIRELKRILLADHRVDFYRCLTEKVFTYALGRAPGATDTETIDVIVRRLESEGGKFSALLYGIVESAPFQKRRNGDDHTLAQSTSDP